MKRFIRVYGSVRHPVNNNVTVMNQPQNHDFAKGGSFEKYFNREAC